jgi:two-component system, chemotaxis family, CheB/CheR fusion protein
MQGNCVLVSVASSIGSLPRVVPSHCSSYFLPQDRKRDPEILAADESSLEGNLSRPLALIVDDVADVTEMLSMFLNMAGYDVMTANSAAGAIELAQTTAFDVVVSDIGLPVMNGYELAQALRALPGFDAVPMIAVTGFSMYDDHRRSLQAGFNAHLTKPIDPKVLFQLIEQLRG